MMKVKNHFWVSKKFQGVGIMFDFDVPQCSNKTYCVFSFKLLFVGFWISFDEIK